MKKLITLFLIVTVMALSSTGCADRKIIDGVTYETYGLFDSNSKENPNIYYELSIGNIIWGIILAETIIMPIYFFGFALWEPVSSKVTNPNMRGIVGNVSPSQTHEVEVYVAK